MDEDEAPLSWVEQIEARRQAHIDSLTVGARVSVDIGECPHFLSWHGYIEQQVTGIIIGSEDVDGPPDHVYHVFFDRPIRGRASWNYAAHELTPVRWPTPEEVVQETLARLDR